MREIRKIEIRWWDRKSNLKTTAVSWKELIDRLEQFYGNDVEESDEGQSINYTIRINGGYGKNPDDGMTINNNIKAHMKVILTTMKAFAFGGDEG